MKERDVYRALALYNDLRAAQKGPKALAKREGRKVAYRTLNGLLRRWLR